MTRWPQNLSFLPHCLKKSRKKECTLVFSFKQRTFFPRSFQETFFPVDPNSISFKGPFPLLWFTMAAITKGGWEW
jgi:hypothetical protein